MKNSIRRFILHTLFTLLPFFAFVAFYVISDPFHVIHPITKTADGRDSVIAGNNAGFTSVETFLAHDKELHYNSFIFGSSISKMYKAQYWKPHLDSTASILHFDASSETLDGIINKMQFLNDHGSQIKNALIIMEARMLYRHVDNNNILYVQHPATTKYSKWVDFHTIFFNAFRNLKLIGNVVKNMPVELIIDNEIPNRIGYINEDFYPTIDSLIANDPSKFFTPERLGGRQHYFKPQADNPAIDEEVEAKLLKIKNILLKNNTNYIIIVPPDNSRLQLMAEDLWIMKSIFGEEHVHDFSGMEKYIGNEKYFYDNNAHLISSQCKVLLDSAFKEESIATMRNPYYEYKK